MSSRNYLCPGWKRRAAKIRARDGQRCQMCFNAAGPLPLEVHHKRYGSRPCGWFFPRVFGRCGHCILMDVRDEDLVTLCVGCHTAITMMGRPYVFSGRV